MGALKGEEKTSGRQDSKNSVVHLRVPTLILTFFLAFVAVATAYLLGVMSGRHSIPTVTTENSPSGDRQHASSSATEMGEKPADTQQAKNILSAEELEFARVLRKEENGPLSRLKATPEKNPAQEAAPTSPQTAEQPARASLQKNLEEESGSEIQDFLFQVGAFRDEKTVDALREKLEGHGLRTMMQRDGKLYLVMVRLRGTAARAAELVALFGELGLGEPILKSRSPVKS